MHGGSAFIAGSRLSISVSLNARRKTRSEYINIIRAISAVYGCHAVTTTTQLSALDSVLRICIDTRRSVRSGVGHAF